MVRRKGIAMVLVAALLAGLAALPLAAQGRSDEVVKLRFASDKETATVEVPMAVLEFLNRHNVGRKVHTGTLNGQKVTLSLDKLNPVSGMMRLFNKDAAVEALKSVLKLLVVGWMAYRVLRDEVVNLVYIVDSDITGILTFVSHISFKTVLHSCGVLLVLSIFDLAWVKWRFIENLKMTKQEVKQETKDSEGDPRIKGKIKQLQYAQAKRRMRKIVPTADVVITNPTHYAVALKYDRDRMSAPIVLIKAVDYMAQQMKEIAREHRVMLVENRFLARELYAQVEEGQEIPESLYAAVAEVLAYVFSLKGKI